MALKFAGLPEGNGFCLVHRSSLTVKRDDRLFK